MCCGVSHFHKLITFNFGLAVPFRKHPPLQDFFLRFVIGGLCYLLKFTVMCQLWLNEMPFSLTLLRCSSDLVKNNILGIYTSSMYESRVFVLSRSIKENPRIR